MASKALILLGLFAVLLFLSDVAAVSGRELGTVKQSYSGKEGPISHVDRVFPRPHRPPYLPPKYRNLPPYKPTPKGDPCGSAGCCKRVGLTCRKCCTS